LSVAIIVKILQSLNRILEAIQRPPNGTLVFAELYFGFQHGLVFGDAANFYLGMHPKVDLPVSKYFAGDKTSLVHGREYPVIKQDICKLDVHKIK
jgi:hypothetical protein